ncbi:MAG: hypothetical protein MZV63_64590 [Marinilabiliales bacterium]|nr:hypothetical protein [Marinilabiliales bacterium]
MAAGATATVTVSINTAANALAAGTYTDTVTFANTTNGTAEHDTGRHLDRWRSGRSRGHAGRRASLARGRSAGRSRPRARPTRSRTRADTSINWTAAKIQAWTTLSAASGTLAAGATATVTVSLNTGGQRAGRREPTPTRSTFTNTTNGSGNTTRAVALTVTPRRAFSRSRRPTGLTSTGPVGGPFTLLRAKRIRSENTGGTSLDWTAAKTQAWTSLFVVSGIARSRGIDYGGHPDQQHGQRSGRRGLHRHADDHEHDQRDREHDPPRQPDGGHGGRSRGHTGRQPDLVGPHRRSVHAVEPGLHAPEHGGDGYQLDRGQRPALDDAFVRVRDAGGRRDGHGDGLDQYRGQRAARRDL